jgi:two-component system, OmpR family, phosphate regulon sensor histidine kinase PhoR
MNDPTPENNAATPLGEAISGLMHDARTPLTSIIGFSELLLEDESLSGPTREYLEIINNEGNRLAEILDQYSAEIGKRINDQT